MVLCGVALAWWQWNGSVWPGRCLFLGPSRNQGRSPVESGKAISAPPPAPLPPRPPIDWTPELRGAAQAVDAAKRLLALTAADRDKVESLGRAAASALEVHRVLQRKPIATAGALVTATGISPATMNKCLAHLERLGMVRELTGKRRSRVYSYAAFVGILNEGTEPPDRGPQR